MESKTSNNEGRAKVLAAACVTMFFISSIALYSVVSKNLLAQYSSWGNSLTWAFPVFQTIMAVTGIFAGRICDKFGPRKVVIAAAVCYGLGWFLSGTATEPWQFYLYFSVIAAIGNGLGYNPALTTGQKWYIDRKGFASGITLAASTAGPAVLSPFLASALIPALGISGGLKVLGVIFFVTILCSALFLHAPEDGWVPQGFKAQASTAHAGTFGDLTPGQMVRTPRFWVLIVTFACAATAGTLLVGKVASIAAVQLFQDPNSAAAVAVGGLVVTVNTVFNLVGRLSFGQITDKIGGYKSLLVMLVITIVALVLMSVSFTQAMFFVALALLGFSFGALLVIYPPLTGGAFGTTNLGVNYGIMFLGYAASTWISQPIAAVLYHPEAGNAAYQQSFMGAVVIAAIAVVLAIYMMVSDSKRARA
ncbi:MAG: MFS transporter [Atopobiaceae bacterium]